MINILSPSVWLRWVQDPWTWNSKPSGVANVFPISFHLLNITCWKTASALQRAVPFTTMLPVSIQDKLSHLIMTPYKQQMSHLSNSHKHRLGLQRRSYGPNLFMSEWQEGNHWWQNCPSELLSQLCMCRCIFVFLSGSCGRCGYFSIFTIGLQSISSLPTLCPHHCVTPCHSPGSALSDDELLVPRLPAGILGYCSTVMPCFWENQTTEMQTKHYPEFLLQASVYLCIYVCLCVYL